MAYPGRVIRRGDADRVVVKQVQEQLNKIGCGIVGTDGDFGFKTESAVKLFQTRRSIGVDGDVGSETWGELFGEIAHPSILKADNPLFEAVLKAARDEVGTRETKGKPNRGERVDLYLRSIGLDPENPPTVAGYSWCAAFVFFCFDQGATSIGHPNPCRKTGSCISHWEKTNPRFHVLAKDAYDNPKLVKPGMIFIVDHGDHKGHTGLVTGTLAGEVLTIEGNTNSKGSREGDGVYEKSRSFAEINLGYIDYSRV